MNKLKKGQKLKSKRKTVLIVKKDNFFEKRQEVLNIIYELKRHVKLPRIEVKIAESQNGSQVVGLGYLNSFTIAIEHSLDGIKLYQTVLHEIVHTVFKMQGHDESCILMSAALTNGYSKEEYLTAFLKYARDFNPEISLVHNLANKSRVSFPGTYFL